MDSTPDEDFKLLLFKIKQKLGVDFRNYRLPCLKRRIDSRIRFNRLKGYREYARFLEQNLTEQEQLLRIITIHLTEFFRDKSPWRVIQHKIIPTIIHQAALQNTTCINVWSAGSASGEEAYTLALLFHVVLNQQHKSFSLKIYGTDIDKDSLKKAAQGRYLEKSLTCVPRSIRQNYFSFDGEYYQIHDDIRQLVHFTYDDLISSQLDKPMDLIVCRNVLIYFNRELQIKIIEKFARVLKEGAYLMLGKTESISYSSQRNLKVFDAKERIYYKKT